MRYRLRTLLIVLVIAPPLLAWGWAEYGKYQARQRELEAQAQYEAALRSLILTGFQPAIDTDGIDEIYDAIPPR